MANIAIIGAGPAGLIAAQKLAEAGQHVTVYEAKPSVARKFLLAGRGGLNLTHSEALPEFLARYGEKTDWVKSWIDLFTPEDLREWASDLGVETFVGSSGRVFPEDFRAKGTLRAWLGKLDGLGAEIKVNHRWLGFADDQLIIQEKGCDAYKIKPDACLFALGGGSYPHMGADAKWVPLFEEIGCKVTPLKASNVGFNVPWSSYFIERFQGHPLKNIALKLGEKTHRGEAMLTRYGIEGNAIYAMSSAIRDMLEKEGQAILHIDLKPDMTAAQLSAKLGHGAGNKSLSSYLKSKLRLSPQSIALLREFNESSNHKDTKRLVNHIKNCPVTLTSLAPIEKAISTAGGLHRDNVDESLMLKNHIGYFVAGEMLDWEAPTGGYLLQACFASGAFAAKNMLSYLEQ